MSRNYGVGSRDMSAAAGMVLREAVGAGEMSFATVEAHQSRFDQFVSFCRNEKGIGRMERIEASTVREFIERLQNPVEKDKNPASASHQQNTVSSINTVLDRASQGLWERVSPREIGCEQRDNVRTEAPASVDRDVSREIVSRVTEAHGERVGATAELSREFGMRMEEAAKFDARSQLEQARETGTVTISNGTKGGQSREVKLVHPDRQMHALERAAAAQGEGDRSMIPADRSYGDYKENELKAARETIQEQGASGWHDFRAGYACERYEELTGHSAPCCNADEGRTADREADSETRSIISEELGHHREDVMVSYVGSAR